jgi:integrase
MAKRERGTGGLLKLKGCRFWYAQIYSADGQPKRISTRTEVKQEAQQVLRNLLVDKDRGIAFAGDVKKIHYEDLRAALITNYIERGNRSLETVKDGSETIWGLKAVDTFFAGYSVTQITTDEARKFAQSLLKAGNANGTANRSLALLRRMLSIALEDGKIQFRPKIRLLKAGPARKGFLALEKFDELLGLLPANLKPLITFLYYCGVRVGEALQIEWSQVDLEGGLIRLEGEQTKNSDARTVPLPNVLIRILEQSEERTGHVFDGTNLRKEWQRACAACGLGTLTEVEGKRDPRYAGLIVHDLRRSAIRNLMKAGVNEKVAMAISGHKTRSVFDRYHIVDTEDVVEAMRRVQNQGKPGGRRTLVHSERTVKNGRKRVHRKLLTA